MVGSRPDGNGGTHRVGSGVDDRNCGCTEVDYVETVYFFYVSQTERSRPDSYVGHVTESSRGCSHWNNV